MTGEEHQMLRLLRRASPLALLLAFLMQATAMAATVEVTIADFQFTPSVANIRMGDTVHWTNNGPSPHTTTSNAPLSLWDSDILSVGDDFSFQFTAAGTYSYFCELHGSMQGRIRPKPTAMPRNGVVGTIFTIKVATIPAPAGFVYDVQKKNPGGGFQNWMTGITSSTAQFDSTGQPTGTYQFRSRLRRLSDNAASGYSPAANIMVT
jgi:plastocyanin